MSSGSLRRRRARGRRRGAAAVLLVLAALAVLLGALVLWIDRQALDGEQWTRTSSGLLANPEIRKAIVSSAVDQLFASANVEGALRDVLPRAGAASTEAALRRLARGLAAGILGTREAQAIWRQANRQAHDQLLDILDQRGSEIHQNQAVALNLEPLLKRLVRSLLGSDVVRAIPGGARQIFGAGSMPDGGLTVLRSDQVRKVRYLVEAVRGLSVALPLVAIVLFTLAVAVADGSRAIGLGCVGLGLAGVGTGLLVGRRAVAPVVADALVSDSSYRSAARAAWMISTTELRDTAALTLILGAVVVAVSVVLTIPGSGRVSKSS